MDDADWARVLMEFYETGFCQTPHLTDETPEHVRNLVQEEYNIHERVEISDERISGAMDYLAATGLIARDDDMSVTTDGDGGISAWTLTEKGFDVAHERELAERNNRINFSLVFLTLVLALIQIVDVAPVGGGIRLALSIFILFVVLVVVWLTDLFER